MPRVKRHKRCRSISSSGACPSMNLPVRPASASQTSPGGSPFCFATTRRVDRRRVRPSHPTCRVGYPGAAARAPLISKHSGCAGRRRSRHHVNQEDRKEPGAAALRPRAARTTREPPRQMSNRSTLLSHWEYQREFEPETDAAAPVRSYCQGIH